MLNKLLNETRLDDLLRRKIIIIFMFIISKNWCVITAKGPVKCFNMTIFFLSSAWIEEIWNWHSLIIHLQWKWISGLNCLLLRRWQITFSGEIWQEEVYLTASVHCGKWGGGESISGFSTYWTLNLWGISPSEMFLLTKMDIRNTIISFFSKNSESFISFLDPRRVRN